ncbi:hypothetical protein BJ085DRAFT_33951 [Dimargaris cristalligena]|uniref:Uncharacterized protein n=1 Tax=Dimargaris cristalligena TaxID=215637 RepID=A0A4V1J518_9FUNG|nr:hypothetical protein BJ085DRAFT_33951 [Dimargaris cristalligena]|eukprot:RKP37509.1 hypothetical protein BJ085DRAFT_33951 [Dimargaris cristalligena]
MNCKILFGLLGLIALNGVLAAPTETVAAPQAATSTATPAQAKPDNLKENRIGGILENNAGDFVKNNWFQMTMGAVTALIPKYANRAYENHKSKKADEANAQPQAQANTPAPITIKS